jgi:threonine aldolase
MNDESPADFRSDTVTKPTPRMRAAMADAEVGDDFYGEDPTVNALQHRAAEMLGTEAALLVTGGSMANLVALMAMVPRGAGVLAEVDSDLVKWEAHATSAVAGVNLQPVVGDHGVISHEAVAEAALADDPRAPRCGLVVVENSHCASGGSVWPVAAVASVASVGLPVLCDGARLFNASVAGGYAPSDVARHCAAVTVSLYKGLGAPMGSLVCGPADLVDRMLWARRVLGGTYRQAGIIAAAGLVALDDVDRLRDDHALARLLWAELSTVLPDGTLPGPPRTNIVVARMGAHAGEFVAALGRQGVVVTEIVPGVVRFVTHRDVDESAVRRAVRAAEVAMAELGTVAR